MHKYICKKKQSTKKHKVTWSTFTWQVCSLKSCACYNLQVLLINILSFLIFHSLFCHVWNTWILVHTCTCIWYSDFKKKILYKNLPCFLHSLDFLFSKLKVLHLLLGWCCLLVAYFNGMVKPVDQNQPIQIKTILLNTENS